MDLAPQTEAESRNDHSSGGDRNQDSDKTDTHWRAHPATDSFDDCLPRRGNDSFGDMFKIVILANILMGIEMWYHEAHTRIWIGMGAGITVMTEAVETTTEAMIPGYAVAEEHLVAGTIRIMSIEEEGTTMKTDMTEEMIGHGTPEMIFSR